MTLARNYRAIVQQLARSPVLLSARFDLLFLFLKKRLLPNSFRLVFALALAFESTLHVLPWKRF